MCLSTQSHEWLLFIGRGSPLISQGSLGGHYHRGILLLFISPFSYWLRKEIHRVGQFGFLRRDTSSCEYACCGVVLWCSWGLRGHVTVVMYDPGQASSGAPHTRTKGVASSNRLNKETVEMYRPRLRRTLSDEKGSECLKEFVSISGMRNTSTETLGFKVQTEF